MKKLLLSFVAFSCLVAQEAAPVDAAAAAPEATVASKAKAKKVKKSKAFKGSKKHKKAVLCAAKDASKMDAKAEATAKANAATASSSGASMSEGPNGWAMSLVGGAVFADSELKNNTTGFDLKYKNTYQRLGMGIHYYQTMSNHVMWALGLDVLAGFGGKKVNGTFTSGSAALANERRFPAEYKQTRPVSAIVSGKLGYSYGCVTPYVVLGLRETYVRHRIGPKVEKDVAFALTPGAGVMFKACDKLGFGLEYTYNMESNFGLDGYAEKVKHKSHAVSARVSYFF